MQQYVTGETSTRDYGFSSLGAVGDKPEDVVAPSYAAPSYTAEPSFADKPDVVEELVKGEVQPPPTVEVRRYSADWDAMQ